MATAKVVGMMLVGAEAWCLGYSLRAALRWCDHVVVGLHHPDAETRAIVTECSEATGRVSHVDFFGPWDEMDFRQSLLNEARAYGATHCAVIDADEALSADLLIDNRGRDCMIALCDARPDTFPQFPMLCPHLPYAPEGASSGEEFAGWPQRLRLLGGRFSAMRIGMLFKDNPSLYYRKQADGYQFHRRTPYGLSDAPAEFNASGSGCFHWQYARLDRLRVKALWYKVVERQRWPNKRTPDELNKLYDWAVDAVRGMRLSHCPPCPVDLLAYGDAISRLRIGEVPWQWADLLRRLGWPGGALHDPLEFSAPPGIWDLLSGLTLHGLLRLSPLEAGYDVTASIDTWLTGGDH